MIINIAWDFKLDTCIKYIKKYIRITGENGISIMPNPLHKLSNTKKILWNFSTWFNMVDIALWSDFILNLF